jgi:hypothetical protein
MRPFTMSLHRLVSTARLYTRADLFSIARIDQQYTRSFTQSTSIDSVNIGSHRRRIYNIYSNSFTVASDAIGSRLHICHSIDATSVQHYQQRLRLAEQINVQQTARERSNKILERAWWVGTDRGIAQVIRRYHYCDTANYGLVPLELCTSPFIAMRGLHP